MAENPYVNKVEYAGQTLMDLTGDTATPSDVLSGKTFHDRSGAPQTGNVVTHNVYDGLDSTSENDALSANQGRVLNNKIASRSACSITRTENSYVSASDLGITCTKNGRLYDIDGNLWLTTTLPASAGTVEIARISNYNATKTIRRQIPWGNNTLFLLITDAGVISITSVSSSCSNAWYRFHEVGVAWE